MVGRPPARPAVADRPPRPDQDAVPGVRTARQTIIAGIGGFATGRFTTPEEVATLISFLASERAGNITVVTYLIDGGLIKTTRQPENLSIERTFDDSHPSMTGGWSPARERDTTR